MFQREFVLTTGTNLRIIKIRTWIPRKPFKPTRIHKNLLCELSTEKFMKIYSRDLKKKWIKRKILIQQFSSSKEQSDRHENCLSFYLSGCRISKTLTKTWMIFNSDVINTNITLKTTSLYTFNNNLKV